MTLSPESIAAVQSTMARRMRLVTVLLAAGGVVGFSVVAWIGLRSATPSSPWMLAYLAVMWPVSLVVLTFVFRWSTRRMGNFLAVLAPRGRLLGLLGAQGLLLLLDNDLLLRFQPATSFRMFFSATGDPVSPDLAEAKRWVAAVRLRRVGSATRTRGDPSLRAELDEIGSRLGSRWARLLVLDRIRMDASNPRLPIRDALVLFPLRNTLKSGEPILRELDSIRHLLVQAASTWPLGPARPIS